MISICMCGAQAGYPHSPECPYPLFNANNEGEEDRWYAARDTMTMTWNCQRNPRLATEAPELLEL